MDKVDWPLFDGTFLAGLGAVATVAGVAWCGAHVLSGAAKLVKKIPVNKAIILAGVALASFGAGDLSCQESTSLGNVSLRLLAERSEPMPNLQAVLDYARERDRKTGQSAAILPLQGSCVCLAIGAALTIMGLAKPMDL